MQENHAAATGQGAFLPKLSQFGPDRLALLLDLDGTLIEIAELPDRVQVPTALLGKLRWLHRLLDGAVAIVSGRPIPQVDEILQPLHLAVAGLHGFERRTALGEYFREPLPSGIELEMIRRRIRDVAAQFAGSWIEDKVFGLALHFRGTEFAELEILRAVEAALGPVGSTFETLRGRRVVEVRPRGYDKGRAVLAFMRERPFLGRLPIVGGDDWTDEAAFAAAESLGGVTIAVAPAHETRAHTRLSSVTEMHDFLDQLTLHLSAAT